jgi:S-methylmethionine-dependent homocysteine/selenocysteine methylase
MTTRKPASPDLLARLDDGPVICAEGYLFELERRGYLQAGPYVPEVVLEHPDLVRQLHREFVHAGSDVVEAFTYYAHREKLTVIGREQGVERLNFSFRDPDREDLRDGNPFPTALDSYACDRHEMASFARKVHDMDVRYIGVCCGAGPHHIRSIAETLGRTPPASRYSPDMSKHTSLGTDPIVTEAHRRYAD